VRSGRAILSDLRETGEPRNVESYAENMQDYFYKRELEEIGKKMIVYSANGRRAVDIMNDVQALMGKIVLYSSKAEDHIFDGAQMASAAYDDTVSASEGKMKRVPTGLADLDKMLYGGYSGGDLIICAARPGQGKTALLLSKVLNMIQNRKAVLFFSLEMSYKQIANRLLSQMTGIDVGRIQAGKLREDEWTAFTSAVEELAGMREYLTVIDMPAVKVGNIRRIVRRKMIERNYDIVMVDYLQLAEPDDKKEHRHLEVGSISRALKALAKEIDRPVLCAAQLSRAVEQRSDKKPILSDLREAGDLEQDSDIVMFIYRPDQYEKDTDKQNIAELIIAKHRNGAVGSVELIYKPSLTRFDNAFIKTFNPNPKG
jgi:replicative DNA helicase